MIRDLANRNVNKHQGYLRTFNRLSQDIKSREELLKSVFNGISAVNTLEHRQSLTFHEAKERKELSSKVMKLLEQVTPRELMQVFPIDKKYEGEKYESKDYFYTMEYLSSIDLDKSISNNIEDFLFRYCNWNLWGFEINHDSYQRKYDYIKQNEEIENVVCEINKQIAKVKSASQMAMDAGEETKNRAKVYQEVCQQYIAYMSDKNFVNRLLSIKARRLEKRIRKAYTSYYAADVAYQVLKEIYNQKKRELSEIDGVYDVIEQLSKTDRKMANEFIIMLNQVKA